MAGNSGGPAIKDGLITGIAFETLDDAENIGYLVPPNIVKHFLEDLLRSATSTGAGFPNPGFTFQKLENKDLRERLGFPESQQDGILVSGTQRLHHASQVAVRSLGLLLLLLLLLG